MDRDAIDTLLDKIEAECPETPFIGSDEWDLNAAYKDGWNDALAAIGRDLIKASTATN
jgi:hypothetical protein